MKWWNRHWFEFGIISAVIALVVLVFMWEDFSILQRISLINFIGILIHQFEEYGFPGGAPYFLNKYVRGGNDKYPLNQFSAMFTNVLIAYTSYLLPIIFPSVIWLGMTPILFGCVFQIVMHLVFFGVKYHHIYNPGLGAVLCFHVPCGIYYIWYTVSNQLVTSKDWIFTAIYMVVLIVLTALLGQKLFSSKDSKNPFSEKEVAAGERLAKKMGVYLK